MCVRVHVSVCGVCTSVCAGLCTPGHTCRVQMRTLGVLLSLSALYASDKLSWSQELDWQSPAPGSLLSSYSLDRTGVCNHTLLLMWVLGI